MKKKAENEKSSRFEAARERLSPAESSLEGRICEVHSGAGFVKASLGW